MVMPHNPSNIFDMILQFFENIHVPPTTKKTYFHFSSNHLVLNLTKIIEDIINISIYQTSVGLVYLYL